MTSQSNPHGESGAADSGISHDALGTTYGPGDTLVSTHPSVPAVFRSLPALWSGRPSARAGRGLGTIMPVAPLMESSRKAGR